MTPPFPQLDPRRAAPALALLAALLLSSASTARAQGASPAAPPRAAAPRSAEPPRLVVVVSVDQLPWDALMRHAARFEGGLARLLREGAVFRAAHDHANTETAPGHAAMLSGRFPRSTGVLSNDVGIQDPQTPVIGSRDERASPYLFRGTTLFDWMRFAAPESRALSVSRKDRSAILMIGRSDQEVYWYTNEGNFSTSSWYADTLPDWVKRFNARRLPQLSAGGTWELLRPASAYLSPDTVRFENAGGDYTFPHRIVTDPARAAIEIKEYPVMDELTLEFALAGVHALRLGEGPVTDLLAVSLSTTDAIGHRYGPDSREYEDQLYRVDRALGAFLDTLFALRDSSRVVVALSSDHGVAPMPALSRARGHRQARTVNVDSIHRCNRCWTNPFPLAPIRARMHAAGVDTAALYYNDGMLVVRREKFAGSTLDPEDVVREAERVLRALPGVRRVDRVASLAARDTVADHVARRWLHMLPPDLPAELVVTTDPLVTRGDSARAQHGTPYDYDAMVPVIFWGAPFRAGRHERAVRVVDLAPTLAAALGLRPSERLDGRPLAAALRRAPVPARRAPAAPRRRTSPDE